MSLYRKSNRNSAGCDETRDMMFDYLDGQLSAGDTERLLCHLNTCAECRDELDQSKQTLNLIQNAQFDVPPSLYGNVMALVGATAQEKRKPFWRKINYFPIGTLAAACAVTVFVLLNRGYIGKFGDSMQADARLQFNAADFGTETMNEGMLAENKIGASLAGGADSYAENAETGALHGLSGIDAMTDDGENEDVYYESTAILTYAPQLTENKADSTVVGTAGLFRGYLDDLAATYPEYALIVCDDLPIDLTTESSDSKLISDSVNTIDEDASLSGMSLDDGEKLYVFDETDHKTALEAYNQSIQLLDDNGSLYEVYYTETIDFTGYCILVVDLSQITGETAE